MVTWMPPCAVQWMVSNSNRVGKSGSINIFRFPSGYTDLRCPDTALITNVELCGLIIM